MSFKKHINKNCKADMCPLIEMEDISHHPCKDVYEDCITWQESCGGHFKIL